MGLGHFWVENGSDVIEASELLKFHNLEPIELHPKDGMLLINGTQLMSVYGAYMFEKTYHLLKAADVASGAILEVLQGKYYSL